MSYISINNFTDYEENNVAVLIKSTSNYYNDLAQVKIKDGEIKEIAAVVEGDVARIPSSELYSFYGKNLSNFNAYQSVVSSLKKTPLPICVRYQSSSCVVVERPPFKLNVRMNYRKSSSRRKRKDNSDVNSANFNEIWIPWTVLIINFPTSYSSNRSSSNVGVSLFFRDSPLSSFEDRLTLPYTPNIYQDGRICLGQTQSDFYDKVNAKEIDITDICAVYQYMVNQYFSGGWNLDLGVASVDSFIFKEIFKEDDYFNFVLKKAEEKNNKFILSAVLKFKRLNINNNDIVDIFNESERSRIGFIYNFLSCLDLEETFQFLNKIQQFSLPGRYTQRNTPIFKDVLSHIDPLFVDSYSSFVEFDLDKDVVEEMISNREDEFKNLFYKNAFSSSNNSLALHHWKIKILVNVEDFLNYASDKMLNKYCENAFRPLDREKYYKKNIATSITDPEVNWYLKKICNSYYFDLVNGSSSFESLLKNAVLSLVDYYRTYEVGTGSNGYELIIDFSHETLKNVEVLVS